MIKIPLLPYTDTHLELYTDDYQLFIGEEKTYELTSNHVQNILVNNLWTSNLPVNYRLTFENGRLYCISSPTALETKRLSSLLRPASPLSTPWENLTMTCPLFTVPSL